MNNVALFDLDNNRVDITDQFIYKSEDVWSAWGFPSEEVLFLTALNAAKPWKLAKPNTPSFCISRVNYKTQFHFAQEFGMMLIGFAQNVGFAALGDKEIIEDDLYFIREITTGHIKIGRSQNVPRRLKALQAANSGDLEIIKVVSKKGHLEKEIHKMFKSAKIYSEWFRPIPGLLEFIKKIKSEPDIEVPEPIQSLQPQTPPTPLPAPEPQALPLGFDGADLSPEDEQYKLLKAIAQQEFLHRYRC